MCKQCKQMDGIESAKKSFHDETETNQGLY